MIVATLLFGVVLSEVCACQNFELGGGVEGGGEGGRG